MKKKIGQWAANKATALWFEQSDCYSHHGDQDPSDRWFWFSTNLKLRFFTWLEKLCGLQPFD